MIIGVLLALVILASFFIKDLPVTDLAPLRREVNLEFLLQNFCYHPTVTHQIQKLMRIDIGLRLVSRQFFFIGDFRGW